MNIHFRKLTKPNNTLVKMLNNWENDPTLIPLIRPNQNKSELDCRNKLTLDDLTKRLENHQIYLIYLDDRLVGEMNYMVDPGHLIKKETGSAWIAITIGEAEGRGKGIGYVAIQYLEKQIQKQGLKRIELGVFEFNKNAVKLYQKLGYKEIGRIENFTFWQGKKWADIRMEKYVDKRQEGVYK
ncbi:RimJ/RimL family protein N-acetyltransferase [Salirhabdus euzebyi]|uniref:RimJ/RimL family protein N-acetyltransferase n=1 Tax=Salirhabdus euzebyi TaxID=394506 RepID=A0A841Q2C3_9BACI|nr:GNAT family N-acetyltransferase [Salirhabdus euzebyi]MBB6452385.1 RimJ/RimL family protein N-acetyltransferase [Salirhabdus euzebyi]